MADKAPLSIRLGEEREDRVALHMELHGLPIRAAVLDLVDRGLAAAEKDMSPRRLVPEGYRPGAVTAAALKPVPPAEDPHFNPDPEAAIGPPQLVISGDDE